MKSVLNISLLVIFGIVIFFLIRELRPYRFPVHIGGNEIRVMVADTQTERERGLSGTSPLSPNTGMFFMFGIPGLYGFWMKEMHYPIDMIWIDQEKKIIHIESQVQPSSYPQIFVSGVLAQYVLEVPAGFVSKNLVNIGDFVIWDFN